MRSSAVGFVDVGEYAACRGVLVGAGYDEASIKAHLKVESIDEARRLGKTALMARTAGGSALDTLIRVMLCGLEVGEGAFASAVSPMEVESWVRGGLVERGTDGEGVRALVSVTPLSGHVFVSDLPVRGGTRPAPDYVMGAASSSMTLANLTVRRSAGLAMDLGTGCGVQAVLASGHCGRIIATDTNERALMLTEVTARLNGIGNIQTRCGSLYEPVEGLSLDLIISNPPFVISPRREFVYRDGGMHGDGISQSVVRGAAERLAPGGYACVLCNWAHLKGHDWQERLAGWASGTGCDLWVLRSWASDPSEYAARWLTHSENLEGEGLRVRHREWMEYYEAAGIEAMGSGAMFLRRSGDPGAHGWARFSESPDKMLGPAGDHVARMMESWRSIVSLEDDGQLRRARVRVNPDLRITRETRPATAEEGGEGWALTSARARIVRGLAYEGTLDPVTMGILASLDGRSPVGDVVSMVAQGLGADASRVMGPALGVVRKWLELGMVWVEG